MVIDKRVLWKETLHYILGRATLIPLIVWRMGGAAACRLVPCRAHLRHNYPIRACNACQSPPDFHWLLACPSSRVAALASSATRVIEQILVEMLWRQTKVLPDLAVGGLYIQQPCGSCRLPSAVLHADERALKGGGGICDLSIKHLLVFHSWEPDGLTCCGYGCHSNGGQRWKKEKAGILFHLYSRRRTLNHQLWAGKWDSIHAVKGVTTTSGWWAVAGITLLPLSSPERWNIDLKIHC